MLALLALALLVADSAHSATNADSSVSRGPRARRVSRPNREPLGVGTPSPDWVEAEDVLPDVPVLETTGTDVGHDSKHRSLGILANSRTTPGPEAQRDREEEAAVASAAVDVAPSPRPVAPPPLLLPAAAVALHITARRAAAAAGAGAGLTLGALPPAGTIPGAAGSASPGLGSGGGGGGSGLGGSSSSSSSKEQSSVESPAQAKGMEGGTQQLPAASRAPQRRSFWKALKGRAAEGSSSLRRIEAAVQGQAPAKQEAGEPKGQALQPQRRRRQLSIIVLVMVLAGFVASCGVGMRMRTRARGPLAGDSKSQKEFSEHQGPPPHLRVRHWLTGDNQK